MAGSFLLRQRKFRQIFDREERRYRKHAYENAATSSVLSPMFHRTTSRLPLVLGSQKRFCEAKDFLGKGDAGVKSAAVAVRRSLAYAPCGDAGGKGELRNGAGETNEPLKKRIRRKGGGSATPPACLWQAIFSRGRARARSGNFPTMGNFQVRKWSKPHRGFAKKALAHPQRGRAKIRNSTNRGSACLPSAREARGGHCSLF